MATGGTPRLQRNDLPPITHGYIMIPKNVDRDAYIENCFRMNRVCVLIEGGVFKTDVLITNEAIQNISFPTQPGMKGTQVIVASGIFRNQPIIVGTVQGNDETQAWSEDIIRFRKTVGNTTISFCMNPKDKQMNVSVCSDEKADLNIQMVGNPENKINVQTSGEVNVIADEKVNVIGYKAIEAKIVNAEVEAEEPGREERRITFDMDKVEVFRKVEDKTSQILFDDNTIEVGLHDKKENILIQDSGITISFNDGEEQIQLAQNLIKLLTGEKVVMNNGGEPLTLANTLINMLNNIENQITTLKNAWTTALSGSASMDGGKAGFGAGVGAVSGIQPLNFDSIKSKVTFSD